MSKTNTVFVIQYEDNYGVWVDFLTRYTLADARMNLETLNKEQHIWKHRIVKRTDEVVE